MWIKKSLLPLAISAMIAHQAQAEIRLPAIISDHMVLQQQSMITLWGWASPGESVTVKPSWSVGQASVQADAQGNWSVKLPTGKAGGPYTLSFKGANTLTVNDVMLGEVWIASGQSNMEFPFGPTGRPAMPGVSNYAEAKQHADEPAIRQINVPNLPSEMPVSDFRSEWKPASQNTIDSFSAVAWFFAYELHRETGYPIGIINSTWGGTPAESWTRREALAAQPTLAALNNKVTNKGKHHMAGYLYNGMIAPIVQYKAKGVIWYQGEANAPRAYEYRTLFPAMIQDWRTQFKSPDLPFYFVQISPHRSQYPMIRDAQLYTLRTVPHTGMAVTTDNGDSLNIHPTNKELVGKRLSRWALHDLYGKKDLVVSGPLYKDMKVSGNTVKLSFDYDKGLMVDGDALTEFTVAGADHVFHPANAKIVGKQVVVWSDEVPQPVAVRFAWKAFPRPNLYNAEHLPASPFRTDDWLLPEDKDRND